MVESTDQLRFNVHVAPDPARMATSFKLRPGPVIIEQLPTRGRHVESLPERMEIASKLARRQLEHIMLRWTTTRDKPKTQQQSVKQQYSPPTGSSLRHTHPPSSPLSVPTTAAAAAAAAASDRHPPPAPNSNRARTAKPPPALRSSVKIKPHLVEAPPHSTRIIATHSVYRSPAQLIRLRRDLAQQVKRLLQLLHNADDSSNVKPLQQQRVTVQFLGSENQGRLMLEEEEERIKEARKTEGWLVRNNRILYQLKQKVTATEREYNKCVVRSHGSVQPDKYGAISSLATGLRTAIRTLQSVTCNGVSLLNSRVCSELAVMLKQLSTIASHLLEDGGTREHDELSLSEVISQLEQYLEARKKAEEHPPLSLPPPARAVVRPSRGHGRRRGPAPGVLLVRQTKCSRQKWLRHRPVGSPGYAKPTFASTIRQSPRRPHLHSSIRRSSPQLDKAPPRQIKNISPVPHITNPSISPSTSPIPHSTSPVPLSRSPVPLERARESEEESHHQPHDLAERELMRQAWLDTRVTEQVHDLQEMRKRGEHELKELQGLLQRPRQLVEEAEETIRDKLNPLLERAEVLKASHITDPQDTTSSEGLHNKREGLQPNKGEELQRVDLELMLQRLEEFEREEGRVRERWRSIVYEDQACSGVVPEVLQCRQFHPVLSRGVASNVDSYSDCYAMYRQRSEEKIGLDTNMLVKCLTEEILDEIVSDVAGEVDTILAGCVDDMFDREFYQPSSC